MQQWKQHNYNIEIDLNRSKEDKFEIWMFKIRFIMQPQKKASERSHW